jgi:nucleotide-binding universal stress UspA family protein
MTTSDERRGIIVVGVDGSDRSKDALRWAARQAKLTRATLEAIAVWHHPGASGLAAANPGELGLSKLAEQNLADTVDEVFGADHPAWLRTRVVEGHAAEVLVDASADADLLVVGSHGHGRFVSALLGPVSNHCVHHARCPVTVIRPRQT